MPEEPGFGMPSVGIVVVTWNGAQTSRRCLRSLLRLDYPRYRICLVDNGSRKGFAESLSMEFPEVDVVALPSNRGYAGGCNAGLAWARHLGLNYVLLLNDDTTVDAGLLRALVARAEDGERPAILAPKVLISQQPELIWSVGGQMRWPWLKADHIGSGDDEHKHEEPRQLEWASGCALFFPLSVVDMVGPLDERYFLYLEDVEWCLRVRRHGIPIWYEPGARLWHEVSTTANSLDDRIVRYYSYRNYYLLAFTNTGYLWRLWFGLHLLATFLKIGIRSTFFPAYRRNAWYQARTRALFDFLGGRFGKAPYSDEVGVTAEPTTADQLVS